MLERHSYSPTEYSRLNETEKAVEKLKTSLIEVARQKLLLEKHRDNPDTSRINIQVLRERYGQAAEAYISARASKEDRSPDQYRQLLAIAQESLGAEAGKTWMMEVATKEVVQHTLSEHGFKARCAPAKEQAHYGVSGYIDLPVDSSPAAKYFRKIITVVEHDLKVVEIPDEQIVHYDIDAMHEYLFAKGNLDIDHKNLAYQDKMRDTYLREQFRRDRELMRRMDMLAQSDVNPMDDRLVAKAIIAIPDVQYNLMVDFKTGEAQPALEHMLVQDFEDLRLWQDAYTYETGADASDQTPDTHHNDSPQRIAA